MRMWSSAPSLGCEWRKSRFGSDGEVDSWFTKWMLTLVATYRQLEWWRCVATHHHMRPRQDILYTYLSYRWQTEAVAGRLAAVMAHETCRHIRGP